MTAVLSQARRAEIRRFYRVKRSLLGTKGLTQAEVEAKARLDAGRFWKIENGHVLPTREERPRLARVLEVTEDEIPGEFASSRVDGDHAAEVTTR